LSRSPRAVAIRELPKCGWGKRKNSRAVGEDPVVEVLVDAIARVMNPATSEE
jgi:hypothetical protein